jgi:TP901 family phage tail tape measure protein
MLKQTLLIAGDSRMLNTALTAAERRVSGFGRKTISTMGKVGASMNRMGDRYLTRFNALLGGAAFTMAGKQIIDHNAKLARLTIQADRTGEGYFKLKEELYDLGKATHQQPGALLQGISAIVERTGNYELAVKTLKELGMVASATGTDMNFLGATASNLNDKMGIAKEEMFGVFDILVSQGKYGAVGLDKMAAKMEQLAAASGRFNVQGVDGVRVLGAWIQLAKKGSGSIDQATTAIEGAIAEMLDPKKLAIIKKYTGFNPIDKEGAVKDLDVVLKGIIKGAKGNEMILGQIFGRESIRALTRMSQVFRETGGFGEFDKLIQKGGDGAMIMKDFAFWSKETAAGISDMKTQFKELSDEHLAKPIEAFTDALDYLNKHPIITKGGLYALLGLGGLALGGKLFGGLASMYGKGKGKAGSGGAGGMLGGMGGPMPVYVVNKHLSMLPGAGGWGGAGMGGEVAKNTAQMGRLGSGVTRLAGGIGRVAFALPAATATFAGVYASMDAFNNWMAKLMGYEVKGKHGVMGDAGAALYDMAPKLFDSLWGVNKGFKSSYAMANERQQNINNINIRFDERNRPTVETDDFGTNTRTNVNLGAQG